MLLIFDIECQLLKYTIESLIKETKRKNMKAAVVTYCL